MMYARHNAPSTFPVSPSAKARRIRRWIAALAVTAFALINPMQAHAADKLEVVLDQAKVLQLPPNTATIILGNPLVADVTMINRNTQLILTGKSYGQTNMIALDRKGNSVGESTVIVKAPAHGLLVQRGMQQETYSCEPMCQPTVRLGDDTKYTAGQIGVAKAYQGAAASGK